MGNYWLFFVLLLAFIMTFQLQVFADDTFFDPNWQFRAPGLVDSTQVSGTQHDFFPVLINGVFPELAGKAKLDGTDIFFTTTGSSPIKLKHEIERYDNGTLVAWVSMNITSTSDTPFFIYFGNPASTDQQDLSLWDDASYAAVFHFNNATTNSGPSALTVNEVGGSLNVTEQLIGNGIDFEEDGKYLEFTIDDNSFKDRSHGTVSAWFKLPPGHLAPFGEADFIYECGESSIQGVTGGRNFFKFSDSMRFSFTSITAFGLIGTHGFLANPALSNDGDWHYVAVGLDNIANSMKVRIDNGTFSNSQNVFAAFVGPMTKCTIGFVDQTVCPSCTGAKHEWIGEIDEVRWAYSDGSDRGGVKLTEWHDTEYCMISGRCGGDFVTLDFQPADDLILNEITPVQAVFDPEKLVDFKTTLLKLDITNTFNQTINNVQITLNYNGTTPGSTITKVETIDILLGTNSYFLPENDFIFPTGAIFSANATIESVAGETDPSNNFDAFTIQVQDTQPLGILYTPVALIFDPEPSPNCSQMTTFSDNSEDYISGVYPINQDEYTDFTNCLIPFPVFPNENSQINVVGLQNLFNNLELFTAFPGIDKTVGVVRDDWFDENFVHTPTVNLTGVEGLAGINQVYDSVIIEGDNNLGEVTAHELFHTYFGGGHSIQTPTGFWVDKRCDMGFFNTTDASCLDQQTAFNYMTDSNNDFRDNNGLVDGVIRAWSGIINSVSEFDFLFNELSEGAFDPPIISIRGIIFDNGTTTIDPWYQFDGDLNVPLGSNGEISVTYLDENDQIIGQTGFNLTRSFSHDDTVLDSGSFSNTIPQVVGTKKITLSNATTQFALVTASDNPPSINIQSPNGGELFVHGETITVNWQSSDLDGDQLSHILLISTDNGQNWIPLQVDIDDEQIDLDVPPNIVSDEVLLRVIATDGFNSNEDISDLTFSIQEFQGALDCSTAKPSIDELWPPNHKMVNVTIEGITKSNGAPITSTITSIFQDESTTSSGGDKSPDGDGIGTEVASLRSERLGNGDGRVYHVFFDAEDDVGATCSGEVLVSVPHDQSGNPTIDGGALFDSTV